jgi:hypothetical protein
MSVFEGRQFLLPSLPYARIHLLSRTLLESRSTLASPLPFHSNNVARGLAGRCSFRLCCVHVPMLPASSSPLGLHQRLCLGAPNIACVSEQRTHSHHLASTNFLLLRHAFLPRRLRESPWPASASPFCLQRYIVHRF